MCFVLPFMLIVLCLVLRSIRASTEVLLSLKLAVIVLALLK